MNLPGLKPQVAIIMKTTMKSDSAVARYLGLYLTLTLKVGV